MGLNAPFFINTINGFYGDFMILTEAQQVLKENGFLMENTNIDWERVFAYNPYALNILKDFEKQGVKIEANYNEQQNNWETVVYMGDEFTKQFSRITKKLRENPNLKTEKPNKFKLYSRFYRNY